VAGIIGFSSYRKQLRIGYSERLDIDGPYKNTIPSPHEFYAEPIILLRQKNLRLSPQRFFLIFRHCVCEELQLIKRNTIDFDPFPFFLFRESAMAWRPGDHRGQGRQSFNSN